MPKTGRKKIEDKIYMTNLQKRFGAKRKKREEKKKSVDGRQRKLFNFRHKNVNWEPPRVGKYKRG